MVVIAASGSAAAEASGTLEKSSWAAARVGRRRMERGRRFRNCIFSSRGEFKYVEIFEVLVSLLDKDH